MQESGVRTAAEQVRLETFNSLLTNWTWWFSALSLENPFKEQREQGRWQALHCGNFFDHL